MLSALLTPARNAMLAIILTAFLLGGYYQLRGWMTVPPGITGDEPSYISIGWESSQGNGYQLDFSSSELQQLYKSHGTTPPKPSIADRSPDTTRPPLLPFIIAVLDWLTPGKELWSIRIWNILCLALTCGLVVRQITKRYGPIGGLLVIPLFVGLDLNTRLYGRAILTEATATLLIALLSLSLMRFSGMARYFRMAHLKTAGMAGLWMTLAIYDRTSFLLWVPIVLTGMVISLRQHDRKRWLKESTKAATVFFGIVIVGFAPWAVRNIIVTGEFMPTGTQGATQLSAAYSDIAWESQGVWSNLEDHHFFDKINDIEMSPLESRIAKAKFSQQAANDWIGKHPVKAAILPAMKVWQSVKPRSISQLILLFFALIGFWSWQSDPLKSAFLIILTACFTGIGMTWSVEGRFLVPVLFVWHCLAAAGICRTLGLKTSEQIPEKTVH